MTTLTRIAALLVVAVALAWVVVRPGFDSIATCGAAVVVALTLFAATRGQRGNTSMVQKVAKGAVAIQSGRDTTISTSTIGKSSDD
jgi:hypothetical protein